MWGPSPANSNPSNYIKTREPPSGSQGSPESQLLARKVALPGLRCPVLMSPAGPKSAWPTIQGVPALRISSTSFRVCFEFVLNGETDVRLLGFYFSKEQTFKLPCNCRHHFLKGTRSTKKEKKKKD